MKRETYLEKIGQLSLEIREADRQIMGLVNLKKLKKNQIRTRILTVPNQQKHLPKQKAQMQQKLLMLNKF